MENVYRAIIIIPLSKDFDACMYRYKTITYRRITDSEVILYTFLLSKETNGSSLASRSLTDVSKTYVSDSTN